MRSVLSRLIALSLAFADDQLPGARTDRKLARCHSPGCRWRFFVTGLDAGTGCSRHPGMSRLVPDGPVTVRCFSEGCRNESVSVGYRQGEHTERDFWCAAHQGRI